MKFIAPELKLTGFPGGPSQFALMERKISKILIANRGEIALRVIRTCKKLGISSVAVYSDADSSAPAVKLADENVHIGPSEVSESYLVIDKIIDACRQTGADAVHPGYGFLSENEAFAGALKEAGVTFIGPEPDVMGSMGDKIAARNLMEKSGVPVVPGYNGEDQQDDNLLAQAKRIGFPVMLKASAGGGGRGMRRVDDETAFLEALGSARREAKNAFGNDTMLLEKFVTNPRHIEIQVFGDTRGQVRHLFERECSIQRRHQKIIEESPSPALTPEIRQAMARTAVAAAAAVNYTGAGTVEFIFSDADQSFYFLEMNTRLQVEHPVTELVTGRDLVEEQIRVAEGRPISFTQEEVQQKGHAIEARIYAEDPARNFMPTTGPVHRLIWPELEGLRVDAGIEEGNEISIYYDPMIAKLIAFGPDRTAATELLERALEHTVFFGPETNIDFLRDVLAHKVFESGKFTTNFIPEHMPNYRGPRQSPDQLELIRTTAGLLFYAGGHHASESPALASVAGNGGDLAPWHDLAGFRIF